MYDQKQVRLFETDGDWSSKIKLFAELPYKKLPFRHRNWGHQLHSVCSYPSKMKPAIAHILVTYFTKPNVVVLDPFSGSGTIPLEACLTGRLGIGCDLNPLGYMITRAKLRPPKISDVNKRIEELKNYLTNTKLTDNELDETVEPEIKEFYHKDTMQEIVKARLMLVSNDKNPSDIDSFIIANLAHILHGNRPYALSRRSHNIIPIPPKGKFVYKSLIKSLKEKVLRILEKPLPLEFNYGESYESSVLNIPVSDNIADYIITSPPFLGTTQFLRQNRVRTWFCGWSYNKQKEMREQFLEETKETGHYDKVFEQFARLLKNNGKCIMHLGVVGNKDMAKEIIPHANSHGFNVMVTIYENTSALESHGRTDRGSTTKHQFLFLSR